MTTLLAHIKIKPGREAQFEAIMKDMVAKEIDTMVMQCNQMYKNFVKINNN